MTKQSRGFTQKIDPQAWRFDQLDNKIENYVPTMSQGWLAGAEKTIDW